MTTLEYAKYYVTRGFSVIPLKAKDKKPAISSWKLYQSQHPTVEELEEWFANGFNYNIGIVTGKISGIAVIDLDSGEAVKFAKRDNNLENTPRVRTAKGYHVYCNYREGIRNFQKRDDLPDIDLRGDGGYIVAPPSIHPSGKKYTWVENHGLDNIPLTALPDIILAKKSVNKKSLKELDHGVSEGCRNDSLARLTGSWLTDGLTCQNCIERARLWNEKNQPPLPDNELIKTVESIYNRHHTNNTLTITEVEENQVDAGLSGRAFNIDLNLKALTSRSIPKQHSIWLTRC